jgi:uncharacterized protein (TIGR02145 family)
MKKLFILIGFCVLILSSFLHSCKKEEVLSVPTVTSSPINNITESTAIGGGTVTDEGSGPVIARGLCWSKGISPTIGSNITIEDGGTGTYSSNLTNLTALTTYIVKAYATNKIGTGYGNEITFKTAPPKINFSEWISYGNLTDQDGNIYRTIKIGEQTWMAENLRTTHYQDGIQIPYVTNLNSWAALNNGAYCFYNNDILNKNTYGALYNWYTVVDQSKICPSGWHVPSDTEWSVLENFLGGSNFAGIKIKEVGLIHWVMPNAGASNQSGFTALPAGSRNYSVIDDFLGLGYYCMWWSSSEHHTFNNSAWYRSLNTFESVLGRNYYLKRVGFSIRCLMD